MFPIFLRCELCSLGRQKQRDDLKIDVCVSGSQQVIIERVAALIEANALLVARTA
jgi:hypothetical protein